MKVKRECTRIDTNKTVLKFASLRALAPAVERIGPISGRTSGSRRRGKNEPTLNLAAFCLIPIL
jgi:hypothetical protein